jgi:hypothetical protein
VAFADALYNRDLDAAQRILLSHASLRNGNMPVLVARACAVSTSGADLLARRVALREAAVALLCQENNVDRQSLTMQPALQPLVQALKSLNAISALPIEVLDEVFKSASLYGAMQIFQISHVCSGWRELVCSVPVLWSIIVSDRTPARLLDLFFQRARNNPVSLAIASSKSAAGELFLRKPTLAHRIDRIVLWRFPTPWGTTPPNLGPLSKAPVLGKVHELIAILPAQINVPAGTLLFGMREGERFPALRSLILDRLVPINTTCNLVSEGVHIGLTLEKLSMSNAKLTSLALFTALSDCLKLTSLILRGCVWTDKEFQSDGIPYSVTLPLLNTLKVHLCDLDFCYFSFGLLKAPTLRNLYLHPRAPLSPSCRPLQAHHDIGCRDLCRMLAHFVSHPLVSFDTISILLIFSHLVQLMTSSILDSLKFGGAAEVLAQLIEQLKRADHCCSPLVTELSHISVLYDPSGDRDIRTRSNWLECVNDLLWEFVRIRQQAGMLSGPDPEQGNHVGGHVYPAGGKTSSLPHRSHEPQFRARSLREVCVSPKILDSDGDDVAELTSSLSDRFGLSVRQLSADDEDVFSC